LNVRQSEIGAAVKALSEGEDRPYMKLWWNELQRVAEDNWDDVFILYGVLMECRIRTHKNPASNAADVEQLVAPRLRKLAIPPAEPSAEPGTDNIDSRDWPRQGLLKYMGYTVGQNDPGESGRRRILTTVFNGPLKSVFDTDYMAQWGSNKSAARLHKMAWSIASFANNRLRANNGTSDDAVRSWTSDLRWLKEQFYERYFGFPWPKLGIN
jgi:hypothetical protein